MKEVSEKRKKELDDFYSLDSSFWPNPLYPMDYDLSMLSKKDAKKLRHGIRSIAYTRTDIREEVKEFYQYDKLMEIHAIYDKVGLSARERRNHWIIESAKQHALHKSYNKMPKPDGRDNKETYVGDGHSGYRGNTIRYPRKKASKYTWNKFYKLFPHLNPKNKK